MKYKTVEWLAYSASNMFIGSFKDKDCALDWAKKHNGYIDKHTTEHDENRIYDSLLRKDEREKCKAKYEAKIARLTAENERLNKRLTQGKCIYLSDSETAEGCVQSPCPQYKTVEDILKENAELHARLDRAIELHAKVRDKIWVIVNNKRIFGRMVGGISILNNNIELRLYDKTGWKHLGSVSLKDYNQTWFTDRAKAEARLAELKGG